MKKILIIGSSFEQLPLILAAKKKKLFVISTDIKFDAIGKFYSDKFEKLDPLDLISGEKIFLKYKPDAISSDACDYSNYLKNFLCTKYNLPCEGLYQASLSCNKYRVREICSQNNILQPRFSICKNLKEVEQFLEKIDFPLIMKPLDGRGSIGVNIVNSKRDMDKKFYDTLMHSRHKEIIVESYIEGIHFTVDGIFDHEGNFYNIGIAKKNIIEKNNRPIILEVNYPAQFKENKIKSIFKINSKLVSVLGFRKGLTHSEYIMDDKERVFLVETTNRGGGVLTSSLILEKLCKININDYLINLSLNISKKIKPNFTKNIVNLRFLNFKPGKVKNIELNQKYKKNILYYKLNFKKGDLIKIPTSGADRHGFIISMFKKNEAIKKLREIISKFIKIKYEK